MTDPTPEKPLYTAFRQEDGWGYGIDCNEGWRSSIVCSGMEAWAAEWLVDQLQGKPYAPKTRP